MMARTRFRSCLISIILAGLGGFVWTHCIASQATGLLGLQSSGEIVVDIGSAEFRLATTLAAELQTDAWRFGLAAEVTDGAWTGCVVDLAASLGDIEVALSSEFDPAVGAFVAAATEISSSFEGVQISGRAMLEPGALGAAFSAAPSDSSPLQQIDVGLNLTPFGTIQTPSCALTFSYARIGLNLPLGSCEEAADIEILWDCDGFVEFTASVAEVAALPFGMQFGGFLSFAPDEKRLEISPAFSLESPDCFDLYAGILWDSAANRLDGFKLYGIGFRSEVEGLRLRGLYALSPNEIALVPAPYTALFGVVWDTVGCCGEAGEGSVAFLFGDEGLFDLGEVLGELVLPITDTMTVTLGFALPTAGSPTLTLGWNAAL